MRAFGARALQQRGYTVLEAASGRRGAGAWSRSTTAPIDLIVSDVVMPEMDGPTLLGELRQRGTTAKIIFVSGYAEDAFRKNLPEGEEFAFLPKPFTLKQLVEAVKAHSAEAAHRARPADPGRHGPQRLGVRRARRFAQRPVRAEVAAGCTLRSCTFPRYSSR